MSQNICNICGANYEYRNGRWKCPACGAYKAEELSPEEATLFNVAAQKLRFCDFDEAEKAYTDIIEKYPQNPNGYWGRLLSRYGIKYEEDFDGRKIPTCYATSIESVISDKDFIKATELADTDTKVYFEQQAQYIERVRKEWVERARKEKPYDIFICYKDSDLANGVDRTQDSIAAQELYIHLTEQGYRVFFSRESLRGKVGEKYEPYIFNALSTAKVMLVYGSKSDYITSTWLKNEWTRYEKRLQAGEKKPNSLIVACDGFSPSELPKVLSSMQCFDATSRSFYTDLDAVLKKIIKGEEKPKPVVEPKPKKKKSKALPISIAAVSVVIAILLCILLPNLLGDKPTASIIDSKYGVVITADSALFDKDTSVIVDKLTEGAQYTALVSSVNASKSIEIKNAIIYDIECDADITKNVTIKVAYPKSSADSTVKVYYVSDDKTLIEEHSCIYDDGFVEFKTSHLSYYVIGEIVPNSNSGGNDNPGENDDHKPPVTPSMTYEEGVLQVGVSANYEPYEYVEGGQIKGIEIDILKAIANELGLEIRFENDEFEDLLYNLNAKDVDCIIGVTETAQRNELATASKVMFRDDDMDFIIYVNKDCNELLQAINNSIDELNAENVISGIVNDFKKPTLESTATIRFNSNGGTGVMLAQTVAVGSQTNLHGCSYTKNGYVFSGWATSESGTVVYRDGATITIDSASELVLYAVWEEAPKNKVVVYFHPNGADGSKTQIEIEVNSSFEFPECEFVREGYSFDEWCSNAIGTGRLYASGEAYTVDGSVSELHFYANWLANENILILDANGGRFEGEGYLENIRVLTGATINLPRNPFVKEGYTFVGWSTIENGSVSYNDQEQYTMGVESEYTLYAIWEAITYTATFKNGDSIVDEVDFTIATNNITEPSVPFKQCYIGSWSDYEIIASNITIYAEYTIAHSNISKVEAKEAQCNATGNIEYWHCSGCNNNYSSVDGTNIVTNTSLSKVPCEYSNGACKWCGATGSPIDDFVFEDLGNSTYTISSYVGEDRIVVIPATYKGRPIVAIAESAFKNCVVIETISLNNNITIIGNNAFEGCTALRSITLSSKVTSIGDYAFSGCNNLVEANIPSALTGLGYFAFKDCAKLDNITVPSGITLLKSGVFSGCTSLKNIILSEGIEEIQSGVFTNCSSLQNIIIPDSVTNISWNGIFNGCSSLETLVLPIGEMTYEYGYTDYSYPIPFLFGTVSYENSFEYECTPHRTIDGKWNTYFSETCYIPNTLRTVYVSVNEYSRNTCFSKIENIKVYWNYVYGGNKIEFDYNDLDVTPNTYKFVKTGESYTFNIPTRTGYTFEGWYHNSTKITGSNGVTINAWSITTDCTLIAKWTPISYTIDYDLDGGSLPGNTSAYTIETSTFVIGEPTRTGYTFIGWSGTGITGSPKTITIEKGTTGTKSYTANWRADEYTITLDAYGGTLNCDEYYTVTFDAEYSITPPTRVGYTFTGWYADPDGTAYPYTDDNGESLVKWSETRNRVLYAQWKANTNTSYTVYHYLENANDSGYTLQDTQTLYGTTNATVYPNTNTYTGFVAPSKSSVKILPDGSAILEYRYTRTTHTITFVTNGGNSIDTMTVKYQQTVEICNAAREGFTFGGWFVDVALAEQFTQTNVSADTTLYAWWKEETKVCNLVYDGYVEGSDGLTIHGYNGGETTVVVPSYIGGMPVIAIGNQAFQYNSRDYGNESEITQVVIPDTVTSIGENAFLECRELNSVTLSNNLSQIGLQAFYNCESLEEITLPSTLTTLGNYAFGHCTSLKTVNILEGIISIEGAFAYCSSLEAIKLPNSIRHMDDAFVNCTSLKTVNIPTGVATFASTFYYCSNLQSITIPNNVTTIGDAAFMGSGITSISIPSSVTTIGNNAFYECSALETISMDIGINNLLIYSNAFGNCSNLISVSITDLNRWCSSSFSNTFSNPLVYANYLYLNGELVTSLDTCTVEIIPHNAFTGYSGFKNITIPDSVTEIRQSAFDGCSNLETVVLGNSVETIWQLAFANCTKLTSVEIQSNITSIPKSLFCNCGQLSSIIYPDSMEQWSSVSKGTDWNTNTGNYTIYCFDGTISKDGTTTRKESAGLLYEKHYNGYYIVSGIGNCLDTQIFIPSTYNGYPVKKIGDRAFENCTEITYVNIPDSVTTIGGSVFSGCSALKEIIIPNSVTEIGEWTFANCTSIETIDLPDNLTTISGYLFEKCTGLKTIVIPDNVTYVGYSFYGCTSLETVTLGKSVTDFYCLAFGNSGVSTLIIKGNVIPFDDTLGGTYVSHLEGIDNLKTVIIEGNVTEIRDDEFRGCSLLETVVLPEGVLTIGSGAFYECSALKEVNIPNSITSIGSHAFYGCSSLTTITIPNNVTTIDYYAFWGCTQLTSVAFANPNGWWYSSNSYAGSGTEISASSLANSETAASLITSSNNYAKYYWRRF